MVAGLLSVILVSGATFQAISLGQVQSWADRTRQPLLVNSIGRSSQSASERGTLIHESWELFTTNPFLGSGPSTTKAVLTARNAPYQKEAHDDYLGALVEEGVLGLGALLFLFVTVATRAARMLYRGVAAEVLEVLVHPEGLVAALASVFVAGLYYETLHFRFVWILFALIAGAQLRDGARSRGQYAGAAG
jgi:O-antigen ligase